MGYEEHSVQGGTTRTILPIVTAERSNSIVSVHVKRYTGYVSTYIVDPNGVTVSTSMGYAMDGQYDTNCVMDNIAHDSYTITKDGDVVVNTRNVTSVGNTTGIEGVEASTNSDHIYTLQGVRLQRPPKQGVYIQNGKKFVAK